MTKKGNIAVKLCTNEVGLRKRDCKYLGGFDLRRRDAPPSLHRRFTRYETEVLPKLTLMDEFDLTLRVVARSKENLKRC